MLEAKIEEELKIDPEIERLQKLLEGVELDLPDKVEINIMAAQRFQIIRQYKLLQSQLTGMKKHRKLAELSGDAKYLKQIDEQITDLTRNCNLLKMQVASIDDEYSSAKEVMNQNLQTYEAGRI